MNMCAAMNYFAAVNVPRIMKGSAIDEIHYPVPACFSCIRG
jgi:hypothetical protein